MLLSFVIPCYRSAKTLEKVVADIESQINAHPDYSSEIILVNDGSPDNTFEVIESLTKKYNNVVGIDIAKNQGQQNALMAGFRASRGDIILASDDDGQTPVEISFQLIDKLIKEDYDVVCAKYGDRGKRTLFRRLGTWADRKMVKVFLEKPDDISTSVFFAARRFVIDEITRYENPYPYWTGLLLRTTHNIGNVEVTQKDRLAGSSGYNLRKLLGLWINGCTTFSIKPLRFATLTGMIIALIGFVTIIVIAVQKFVNPNMMNGWTSMIATMLLIGGLIMMMLGVIGEYIGRIYLSLNGSPQYVIRRIIDNRQESDVK